MSDQPIIVKKIKKSAPAHHGGSWKVAFADFMTAMMAFFLVMWIIGLNQDTRSAIAGYFQDPYSFFKKQNANKMEALLNKTPPKLSESTVSSNPSKVKDAERQQLEKIQNDIKQAVAGNPDLSSLKDFIKTEVTDEGLRLEFIESLGSVFFETGSANIRPQAQVLFLKVGAILGKANHDIVVDGHTDSQKYTVGAQYDNWNLSQDRAMATLRVLMEGGVADRFVLASRGFADKQLRDKKNPYSFVNRRVSVLLPYTWAKEKVVGSSSLSKPVESIVSPRINILSGAKSSK